MTTDHDPPGLNGRRLGPAEPAHGLGRRMRVLAGVDERLLDWVPGERPRYTALGGVVLGTATIAALSMFMALNEALGGQRLVTVLPALVWGAFVCNLDRWLVSSAAGSRWRSRASVLVPRLLLAVIFAIIIAEPLVLRVFQSAIEQQVRDDRQRNVADLQGHLVACNPVPATATAARGLSAPAPGCADAALGLVDGALPGLLKQLEGLQEQRAELAPRVSADTATQAALNDIARQECNGVPGDGLSGRYGVGPNCTRDREQADQFGRTSQLAQNTSQLATLDTQIGGVQGQLGPATTTYRNVLDNLIMVEVAERKDNQRAIGLLERFDGLHSLVARHPFLRAAEWAVRIFFVVVDCLPVLVKLMSASTTYERLVEDELEAQRRTFQQDSRTSERPQTADLEIEYYREDRRIETEKDQIDGISRRKSARRDMEDDAEINALMAQLLAQAGTWQTPIDES